MNKKTIITATLVLGIAIVGGVASASEVIGTATGQDGDIKDVVRMNAEVVSVDGSEVTFVDSETGQEYSAGFGPSRYSGSYEVGQKIVVEGVEDVSGDNEENHNFNTMKVDDVVLRESYEGTPAWAGQGRQGAGTEGGIGLHDGTGMGSGGSYQGSMEGGHGGQGLKDGSGTGDCENQ